VFQPRQGTGNLWYCPWYGVKTFVGSFVSELATAPPAPSTLPASAVALECPDWGVFLRAMFGTLGTVETVPNIATASWKPISLNELGQVDLRQRPLRRRRSNGTCRSRGRKPTTCSPPPLWNPILSLAPHNGFTKSRVVRDNVISFEANGQPCEIRFLTPVAGNGTAWNLYVMHDPGYLPKENQRAHVTTGKGRLDELVERRF
jgi:hypothetical protein